MLPLLAALSRTCDAVLREHSLAATRLQQAVMLNDTENIAYVVCNKLCLCLLLHARNYVAYSSACCTIAIVLPACNPSLLALQAMVG